MFVRFHYKTCAEMNGDLNAPPNLLKGEELKCRPFLSALQKPSPLEGVWLRLLNKSITLEVSNLQATNC